MASAAAEARKKAEVEAHRRELAEELLDIHIKHRVDLERADAIKAALKQIATEAGATFQVVILDKGKVNVSGEKAERVIGEVPDVDTEAFLSLSPAKRAKLLAGGIVRMVNKIVKAYHGQVTVKPFPAKA
jgi:hypothetical protein